MQSEHNPQLSVQGILWPVLLVLAMWLVFWFEVRFSLNFNGYGIYPRAWHGLRGIIFGPFIHGNLKHLFNNSIPILILSAALFYFYRGIAWKTLLYGLLLTGALTWLIGRPANHIGASGIVYMLVAFLFFKGIFSKNFRLAALSMAVVFMYGGLWWYVMPVDPKISWEGHLSGFVAGFILSLLLKNPVEKPPLYDWQRSDYDPEEDEFMQQFDEEGNFTGEKKRGENEARHQFSTFIRTRSYIVFACIENTVLNLR